MNPAHTSVEPRLPAGTLVITPGISFALAKRGVDVAQFGAYHASQDTRFRNFSTGGFANNSRPEADYFPRGDRAKVIARSRLAFRNNPYLAAVVDAYVAEIGAPTMKSQTTDPVYNDLKERLFERWARDCEADQDLSLDQVIEIYNYEDCVGGGELFIVKRREGWLQLIASELCGSVSNRKALVNPVGEIPQKFSDGTTIPAGATERDGIIRDANNFKIGYRFGTRDDQGCISFGRDRSTIVPVGYVIHLYDPKRAEQDRGIPRCAAVSSAFQDVFETSDARAQQVKNAACLSLWITKNIDPYGYAEAMRGGLRGGDVQNAAALKEAVATRSGYQEIKKGAIYYGAVGEDLKLIEPKINAGDFHTHYLDLLQVCCACFNGMPVEIGIAGFGDSNYSSSRATVNKWKRNVVKRRRFIAAKFLDPLQLWQCNRAHIFRDLPAPPAAPNGASYNTDENVFWGWPPIPDIDGAKTSAQNAIDLANGTTTRDAILSEHNKFGDEQDRATATEKARLLKLLIAAGKEAGLTEAEAKAWALSQQPQANGPLFAPLIAAELADGAAPKNAVPADPAS